MGEYITPPTLPPTTYCRRLLIPNTPEWIGTVTGALMSLIYESEWKQTTGITAEEASNRARVMFDLYLNSGNDGECGEMACCEEKAIINRVNPDSGVIEQSTDGGATWHPAPNALQQLIVQPIPPVTSGVAETKCDAATNVYDQFLQWIDQVSNDFTTATTLLEFGQAVILAIVGAVLVVVTGGALAPVEALLLAALGAALIAAWGAGKAVFDAYWTTENKDIVFCAAYNNIGADGSYTDAQFSAFWNECNSLLPPSPAKMLFMGFLSSIGAAGLNAMAASGMSADGDCADCEPLTCDVDNWQVGLWNAGSFSPRSGEVSRDSTSITVDSIDRGDGTLAVYITSTGNDVCCGVSIEVISGTLSSDLSSWAIILCGDDHDYTNFVPLGTTPLSNFNSLYIHFTVAGRVKITFF